MNGSSLPMAMTFLQRLGKLLQLPLLLLCKLFYVVDHCHHVNWKTKNTTKTNYIYIYRMVHGFGEHIARYDRMFSHFVSQGIECYGYDQRGWGETGKKSAQFGNNQG
jgi:alpha-beta hydrolase superfamily lysophospholipase